MTTKTASRLAPGDASVVPSVRGVPWWGAVALAGVLTLAGAAIDGALIDALGWSFRIGFLAGVASAVLAVRRRSVFTAMVQPPLVLAFGIIVGGLLFTSTTGLYATALKVIAAFPTMAIGTAVAVVLGVIRLLAEPMRPRRPMRTGRPNR